MPIPPEAITDYRNAEQSLRDRRNLWAKDNKIEDNAIHMKPGENTDFVKYQGVVIKLPIILSVEVPK